MKLCGYQVSSGAAGAVALVAGRPGLYQEVVEYLRRFALMPWDEDEKD